MPILICNWGAINNCYVLKHAVGDEKYIRAIEFGIRDLTGHLVFYPQSILCDHLGPAFLWGSAIAIVSGLVARILARPHVNEPASRREEIFPLQIIFLLGAILGPIVVLTADISKSPVVGGIVGVPAALLIVAISACLAPSINNSKSAFAKKNSLGLHNGGPIPRVIPCGICQSSLNKEI